MSRAIHPICLALCLAGWAVSGASVEGEKTSPVCYLCNHDNCPTVEYVYDHLTANLTLWSRGKMVDLPPCPTHSPLSSGGCLVCVDNQKIYAVCDSEIIKPVFEGQGNSMPIIKANCKSIVSTDWTDPNVPTSTPGGTGRLSKEEEITIGILAATLSFLAILVIVAWRYKDQIKCLPVALPAVKSGEPRYYSN
ncbi:uncharacterized protein LOC109905840 [Oncorhynchus kisutch]|uniref:uncharacterized protein LOC109905840 n=1 Tax=Oncorhynchus kisutch TaxID=8019 RepID=UPI0012DD5164|nr:uncharacterized protein LOC109905840 [Oncorhynchus kisutch]